VVYYFSVCQPLCGCAVTAVMFDIVLLVNTYDADHARFRGK